MSRQIVQTSRELIEHAQRTVHQSKRLSRRHVAAGLFARPGTLPSTAAAVREGDVVTDVSFGQHAAVDGTVRLTVTGEVDMDNAWELEAAVKDALEEPHVEALIIDLDQTGFLDSSGIRALLQGHASATAHGTRFGVENPRPNVRRVLDITGVLPMLTEEA